MNILAINCPGEVTPGDCGVDFLNESAGAVAYLAWATSTKKFSFLKNEDSIVETYLPQKGIYLCCKLISCQNVGDISSIFASSLLGWEIFTVCPVMQLEVTIRDDELADVKKKTSNKLKGMKGSVDEMQREIERLQVPVHLSDVF